MMGKIFGTSILSLALAVLLVSPAWAAPDTACMVTAVEKRDNAVISAWDTFSATIKSALETRRDSLKAAWTDANQSTRRASIKQTWRTYRNSRKSAWRTRRSAIFSAWRTFKAERNACGAAAADEVGTQAIDLSVE